MQYIEKDITTVEAPAIIIHGVNCQRKMGSGVAKALYTKWPEVKHDYMQFAKKEMVLGKISAAEVEPRLYVLKKYGYDGAIYASSQAIRDCLTKSMEYALKKGIERVYSPRNGSGLGGLNWKKQVEPIFEDAHKKYLQIEITICDYN